MKAALLLRYSARITLSMIKREPYKLTLMTTGGCNYKCKMCDIWTQKRVYLSLAEMQKQVAEFPGTLSWVNISGGEPFLNPDLKPFISWLAETRPGLLVSVTTNGSKDYGEDFFEFLNQQRRILFYNIVSIDGPEALHDRIRGKADAFQKANGLVERLLRIRTQNPLLEVSVGFTLMPENQTAAVEFVRTLLARGLRVNINLVQNSPYYLKVDNASISTSMASQDVQPMRETVRGLLKLIFGFSPEKMIKSIYLLMAHDRLLGRFKAIQCYSITDNLLIHSDGNVKDCTLNYASVSNPNQSWKNREAQLRGEIAKSKCEETCLTPCEKYLHIQHMIFKPWKLFTVVMRAWSLARS